MKRSPLQVVFESVTVVSLANGDLRVTPVWRGVRQYSKAKRMAGARRLEWFINAHLRKAKP